MYDVCLLEFRQSGDIRTGIGYVYSKEMSFIEVIGLPDNDSFPYEFPYHAQVMGQFYYGDLFGLFVAHQ